MTITVNAGSQMMLIFGIILGVIVLSMLLKKGDFQKKIIAIVILLVVFGFVFFSFGRPSEIVLDEHGLDSGVYGKISFDWEDVDEARLIRDYQDGTYKPVMKLNGNAMKGYRSGTFKLAGGEKVKLVTQRADDALFFSTSEGSYLFAVDQLDSMYDYASKYIEITE